MCDEIGIDKLVGNIKPEEYSLLCGNGLTKCVYGESWKNPDDKFYENTFSKLIEDIKDTSKNINCPEKLFDYIRIRYALEIFSYYQSLQITVECEPQYEPQYIDKGFLTQFKNIYTLNYDVLMPRTIAKISNDKTNPKKYMDGFLGSKDQKQGDDKNWVYYLHGAFHLLHISGENQQYKKITSDYDNGIDLLTAIQNVYQKVQQAFIDEKCEKIIKNDPLLVFASRYQYKLGAILTDSYLKNCYEKLKAEKRVVVFGCSFKNDEHILEALMSGESKEIYIGYYCDKDREYFINKLKGKSRFKLFNSKELCKRITKGENNDTRSE